MRLVAMKRPVSRFVRDELERAHSTDRNIDRDLRPLRAGRDPAAVGAGHGEVVTMQMDRMTGHGEIAHAHAHAVALAHDQRVDPGEGAAVEGPETEIEHRVDPGRRAARIDVECVDEKDEVAVDPMLIRIPRVDHDEAVHAHRHLHHLVGVRVVHERPAMLHHEFVRVRLAGLDVRLREPADAVHAIGQPYPAPVNRRVLGQLVGDEDAHSVALDALDGRAGTLAVVAPQIGLHAGRNLADDGFGDQMKLLDAILHAPRECPAVQGYDRVVRPSVRGNQRWLRRRYRLQGRFRQ